MAERIIYDSEREGYINLLEQLQRLREEGKHVEPLEQQTYAHLVEIVEQSDAERLTKLRKQLKRL